jgi:hypothetical protein
LLTTSICVADDPDDDNSDDDSETKLASEVAVEVLLLGCGGAMVCSMLGGGWLATDEFVTVARRVPGGAAVAEDRRGEWSRSKRCGGAAGVRRLLQVR